MKVLLTGANGYIGSRLIPLLVNANHELYLLVRDPLRLHLPEKLLSKVHIVKGDLLNLETLKSIPNDIDAAYYLVHSMSQAETSFDVLDKKAAENFREAINKTHAKQIIYLSGIQDTKTVSKHLQSRMEVEKILQSGTCPVTVLRAAVIIGSGSASFEIMRDLVEKLPVMVAPRWVKSICQPIAVRDVLYYLEGVLGKDACINKTFDIGGPDVLPYKNMLLQMADVRGLKRWIIDVPVLTPKLSSYWLLLVTTANFYLARSLIDSLKNDVVCKEKTIQAILPRPCLTYKEALIKAFDKIDQHSVISSWKDSISSGTVHPDFLEHVKAPDKGCYKVVCSREFSAPTEKVYECFTQIGGEKGWYFMNWAWIVRGLIDKFVGGVGLRRGRVSRSELRIGDPLDFWRVLLIDPKAHRLLLYAEMRMPGEAWLEFSITNSTFTQTAIFRPLGLFGRLYWIILYPIHFFLFRGLAREIVRRAKK